MSKAVEEAYNAYPLTENNRFIHEYNAKRVGFKQGYEQAEKDLALTWEDIEIIGDLIFEESCKLQWDKRSNDIYKTRHYQEVLTRFKKLKDVKQEI